MEASPIVSFCGVNIPYGEFGVTGQIFCLFILSVSWSAARDSLLSDLWWTLLF